MPVNAELSRQTLLFAPGLIGQEMAAPRKVFRIEEMAAARLPRRGGGTPAADHFQVAAAESLPAVSSPEATPPAEILQSEILRALGALHATMAATAHPANPDDAPNGDIERLGLEAAHVTRIALELDAVVNGTAQATQKILAAAEEIDQAADNLSAALKGRIEQDVAQDIRDLVIRIFEACNFQDLIGQRVTKVMATLKLIEDQMARMIVEAKHAPAPDAVESAQYLHGPRLDFDRGHVTQAEIDAMFEDT
jgi:chemotaxis protein CheZ